MSGGEKDMIKTMVVIIGCLLVGCTTAMAWNYEGHRYVAAIAVASLPDDFPAFARSDAASERAQFLSGEPDRWRNLRDPGLKHINDPDHYFDLEHLDLYGLTPETVPELRNELLGAIYIERLLKPEKFPVETKEDTSKVNMLMGTLPYAIHENFLKLKSGFVSLREMNRKGASAADISQIEQNIVYIMGVMSHFVGDGAQPLHMTVHHHGWVGENPRAYTTSARFHRWIDGGFIEAAEITYDGMKERIQPSVCIWPEESLPDNPSAFPYIIDYLVETHRRVEPLYELEKDGKLGRLDPSAEGRLFIEDQLLRGGQVLGNLYYSAFKSAERVPLYSDREKPAAVVPE